jgi:hypothetical protein
LSTQNAGGASQQLLQKCFQNTVEELITTLGSCDPFTIDSQKPLMLQGVYLL